MKIAIIHYHLHPGGVTRIIRSQAAALKEADIGDIIILCGDQNHPFDVPGVPFFYQDCLGYHEDEPVDNLHAHAETIRNYIKKAAGDCILHIHNANLGKNPALTLAVSWLAREGLRIVNHCHDFAEDRPENQSRLINMARHLHIPLDNILYPEAESCHFAVLNRCDYQRVLDHKIPPHRVHLLPNPVSVPAHGGQDRSMLRNSVLEKLGIENRDCVIVTYPVRGIRRKNLGEFILLSAITGDAFRFILTQPPRNAPEIPSYEKWKKFVLANRLPVIFEAGEKVDHEELIRISDFCITTSIREGFGMAYLEPWLSGTPLAGRNIPCVTADLLEAGLLLPRLYDHVWIAHGPERKDFSDLSMDEQEAVILNLLTSRAAREKFLETNSFLRGLFSGVEPVLIGQNRQTILTKYSVHNYGKRLSAIYKNIPG